MRTNRNSSLFPAIALVPLAACHGSAEIVVTDPHPVYSESEPNDDVFGADSFGFLHAGERFSILGDVRDDPYDPQDGFAFVAAEPIVVDFTLQAGCGCADLELWVYDPLRDEFVGVFDAGSGTEHGSISVYAQEFHLIVVSAVGDASYRLDLGASTLYAATAAVTDAAGAPRNDLDAARARLAERTVPAELERYRVAARVTGPPQVVEIYAIDPERGVVERARVLAAD